MHELKSISEDYLSTIGNPNYKIELILNISTHKIFKFVMPAIMMMADVIIKGGKIVVNETECSLNIEVSSDNNLNVSKLKGIESVINSLEVSENISSYAPLYYLIANTNNSNAKVKLVNNTLVIGD